MHRRHRYRRTSSLHVEVGALAGATLSDGGVRVDFSLFHETTSAPTL